MLTPEQIKKLIEIAKPEGFRFTLSGDSKLGGGYMEYMEQPCSVFGLYMPESIMYPLFLQKCIEGVIKKYGFQFDAFYNKEKQEWDYMFFNKFKMQYPESQGLLKHINNVTTHKDIDQAKEQALIYILDNIQKQD